MSTRPCRAAQICIVAPEFIGPYPNGGVGTACYWEATNLGEAGHDVTVLYTGPTERESPEHWEAHFARQAPFRYVDAARWAAAQGTAPRPQADDGTTPEEHASDVVLDYLRQHRFDLVLIQEFQGHGLRALQARQCGDCALSSTRLVVTLHSSRQWTCEGMQRLPLAPDLVVDFLERESARLADRVIAPSRSMADWVVERWGLPRPAVIPYCYDPRTARSRETIEHRGPFRHLVFFGRLETRKGAHLLVRAIESSAALRASLERVTFLGRHARIEGVPSTQFLDAARARLAPLPIDVISDMGSLEALSWLEAQTGILVVAPSLGDNLPYAVIELFTRRIPLVSTRVGGIPEIVGRAHAHLLAEPSAESLRAVLERTCAQPTLTIDYRDGYDAREATRRHIEFVEEMLGNSRRPRRSSGARSAPQGSGATEVVVVDARTEEEVEATRRRCCATDQAFEAADWLTLAAWLSRPRRRRVRAAVFMGASVTPRCGLLTALQRALSSGSVDAATSYYEAATHDGQRPRLVRPLGSALAIGWSRNIFGGPCFAARPQAFPAIEKSVAGGTLDFWAAYAAIACSGRTLTVVPDVLYSSRQDEPAITVTRLERVVRAYTTHRPRALDIEWTLKAAHAAAHGEAGAAAPGRTLYDRLTRLPDAELCGFAELDPAAADSDPHFRDFAHLRRRLAPILARWERTHPRAFIYGAGLHTRMLLAAVPALGRFVAGFIDRRAHGAFLGKPCIRPDEFRPVLADAIVYSSREFERDMHVTLAAAPVEHVLLYHDVPDLAGADQHADRAETTAGRLRRRFSHSSRGREGLVRLASQRPEWTRGSISNGDMEFLFEIVHALSPHRVLEIGVAAGCSSAALLYALDQLPASAHRRELHSIDVADRCYFDASHATGAAARIMYRDPQARWVLRTGLTAAGARVSYARGTFDLAFIDADHRHPYPLLDLLQLTELLPPGAWVVLHDIELPLIAPRFPDAGAQLLFARWPFNKIHGLGDSENIGAVQLPDDPTLVSQVAEELLRLPWQATVSLDALDVPPAFSHLRPHLLTHPHVDGQRHSQAGQRGRPVAVRHSARASSPGSGVRPPHMTGAGAPHAL